MSTSKSHALRALVLLIVLAVSALGCSSSEPTEPNPTAVPSPDGDESSEEVTADTTETAPPVATAVPEPTLADEDIATVVELQAGDQVEDAQGNIIAIYGIREWPESFDALSDEARSAFPFFGDVDDLTDSTVELVALDVGICTAGIDASGFGTAEFFVHDDVDEVLSTDLFLDRGVLTRHPVRQPGFDFPAAAECGRGWLPILWSGDDAPLVARYVLATRASATTEVERHVYQWQIDSSDSVESTASIFEPGQTVTFNDGTLAGTTIDVAGWTELIGVDTGIEGTRAVAVSLSFCPASTHLPDFGLSVDGWNLIAPAPADNLFGARSAADPSQSCFDGWLQFAVPFGGVPTGFFASDGIDAADGYAQWSLENAALPAPQ